MTGMGQAGGNKMISRPVTDRFSLLHIITSLRTSAFAFAPQIRTHEDIPVSICENGVKVLCVGGSSVQMSGRDCVPDDEIPSYILTIVSRLHIMSTLTVNRVVIIHPP